MSEEHVAPSTVCLAVSSFAGNPDAIRLVELGLSLPIFEHVVLVDSCSRGIPPFRDARFTYVHRVDNLGSAGNLALRLTTAASRGSRYVYAINHDGCLEQDAVIRLVEFARNRPRVAAAYPLRWLSRRGGYDLTGTRRFALPLLATPDAPDGPLSVTWSSSNGALYSLDAVRNGLVPRADFWMGWEDLEYGWRLLSHGWEQYIVPIAQASDDYEYGTHRAIGLQLTIADKPSWYAYYHARNLLRLSLDQPHPVVHGAIAGARIVQEAILSALFKDEKVRRLQLLLRGTADALDRRMGRGPVP